MRTLIADARIIDPASGRDEIGSILIEDERIADLGPHLRRDQTSDCTIIEAGGLIAIPGLIDARVVVGEPGAEHKETLKSAGRAAAAGGVTTIVVMPNTAPVIDDVSLVEFIKRRGKERAGVRVAPSAALTDNLAGAMMTEIGLLSEAGAVLFSNGNKALADSRVLRRALSYATAFDALVAHRPEDPFLAAAGVAHEGALAGRLGLAGIPSGAERIYVDRDIALARMTKGRLLLDMLSSADSLAPVRRAKEDGLNVAASVSIHHLALNELEVGEYRTFAKLSPPLRSEEDRRALLEAVIDGSIDLIVSGHDPQPPEEKRLPFAEAAFGASGLETLLPALLSLANDGADLSALLAGATCRPAQLLGLDQGRLRAGAPADIVLADLGAPHRFVADAMVSKCRNSPFDGRLMQGQVIRTIVGGRTLFERKI